MTPRESQVLIGNLLFFSSAPPVEVNYVDGKRKCAGSGLRTGNDAEEAGDRQIALRLRNLRLARGQCRAWPERRARDQTGLTSTVILKSIRL